MIKHISVDKLYGHFDNPRKDLGDLTELTESIKKNGILQNLTVVKEPRHNLYKGYIVIIGHRRLAAAKMAGLETVPCIVAEMTEEEQIATMLTENMQREDLTVYEQAQGFQLMLDLGESVSDIAEKTGFSDTTVRRRVKLLDLDQEKFKESESRNVTLQEYASLEKIKDLELRNKVLEYAGTSNFNNELKRAIEKEKAEVVLSSVIKKVREFAIEVDNVDGMLFVKSYSGWSFDNDTEIKTPGDTEEKYFYKVIPGTYWSVSIYKKEEDQGETEEERKIREENERTERNRSALSEINARAYKLRKEFAKSITKTKAKDNIGVTASYLTYKLLDGYVKAETKDLEEITGDKFEIEENSYEKFDKIVEKAERNLFALAYCLLDAEYLNCHNWRNEYEENDKLNQVYNFLKEFGYQMSDEEKAMQDGTHELYEEEEE